MSPVPVVNPSTTTLDPQTLALALRCLRNSHAIEHQAIASLKAGNVRQCKIELQRQIAALVSVLAML